MATVQHNADIEWPVPSARPFGESAWNREIERRETRPVGSSKVLGLSISGHALEVRLFGLVDEARIRTGSAQQARRLQAGQNADVVLW